VRSELVAQWRQEVDVAQARLRLGVDHADPPRSEVDVAPAERERLGDPQPREDEGGDQRAAMTRAISPRRGIEFSGGVEEPGDLVCAVEVGRAAGVGG